MQENLTAHGAAALDVIMACQSSGLAAKSDSASELKLAALNAFISTFASTSASTFFSLS